MRPLPLLILLVLAMGIVQEAPLVGEAHRFELMLGLFAAGGGLTVWRGIGASSAGILWDDDGLRRPLVTALGTLVLLGSISLVAWKVESSAGLDRAAHASPPRIEILP